ncbi:hypothetical protein BG015_005280 [Linnemannia schmuckeri]|uniref:BHLH domain-containing protein n=1 Tax=Linnemannia schmuckeri TaxID=64567 RepID=A0A9P5S1Q8_9FUNG|nr:hypothetical protein BG015_005280 [Linnemannia schmuckeri]
MDNDNNDDDNNSFNSHPLTSDNNRGNTSDPHDSLLKHASSNLSEFCSESIADAHFSPVAVTGSRPSSGTSETDYSAAQSTTGTTTIIAIDSLAITALSTSTSSRSKKVAKRGAQTGTTFTFPSISAGGASIQGASVSVSSTISTVATATTMAVTVPAEPAADSAVTSSALTIPTNTPAAATVISRPIKTGRHNRGERMTFELDDVLREYTPDQFKTCKAYDVGGVNILNKKPVDSKTALDKIKRRRETHNRVERRRRDCINQLIDELTALLPKEDDNDISKSHRVNILRAAIAHIQNLTRQNENLQQQVDAFKAGRPMPPPAIITTFAPMMDYDDSETAYSDNLPSPAAASHSAYSPRSPLSPSISAAGGGTYSPLSSPGGPLSPYHPLNPSAAHTQGSYQEWKQPSRQLNPSSGGVPTSYSNETTTASTTTSMPDIPMIVEPSEQISTPELGSSGMGSKRLNRQTLPRLQLAPPPFHQHSQHHNQHKQQLPPQQQQKQLQQAHYQHQYHGYYQQQHYRNHNHSQHRSRSNSGGGSGYPQSSSYYDHDSASATSPTLTYSDYSSATGPWSSSSGGPYSAGLGGIGGGGEGEPQSSTSSSFGTSPRSPHFSNYGPSSPYSPYGSSSAHAQMSPSPGLAP